jgi:hypothetical protein
MLMSYICHIQDQASESVEDVFIYFQAEGWVPTLWKRKGHWTAKEDVQDMYLRRIWHEDIG